MSELAIVIGSRIKSRREQQGLSQEALAELLSCNPKYVKQAEKGDINFSIDGVSKFATVLEMPLSELFEDSEKEDTGCDYPLMAYEFFLNLDKHAQKFWYTTLDRICNYEQRYHEAMAKGERPKSIFEP